MYSVTQAQIDSIDRALFESKYTKDPVSGCWNWTRSVTKAFGYGIVNLRFSATGRAGSRTGFYTWQAHRVAYMLKHGPIPRGICVLHRCDNPRCVNPEHLFSGTQAQNVEDMHAKGRNASKKGTANGNNRLSEKQVLTLRGRFAPLLKAKALSVMDVANILGVGVGMVYKILRGESWAHLLPKDDPWEEAEEDHKQMTASGGSGVWAAPYMADPF